MKRYLFAIIFLVVLAGDLLALVINLPALEQLFKPLLMLVLAIHFIINTQRTAERIWVIGAIVFSWIGDILLMFQANDAIFFLLGLSAFLLAHLFYIVFFHRVRIREKIKGRSGAMAIAVLYYLLLMIFLSDHLGNMKMPVRIYGIVICFMWMLSMHMLFLKNKVTGQMLIVGATFFVASDSVLAVNKFYQSFQLAGPVVMATYGIAQLLIITGAIQYLRKI
jgi:uncharacterized membrane protein YhhN